MLQLRLKSNGAKKDAIKSKSLFLLQIRIGNHMKLSAILE